MTKHTRRGALGLLMAMACLAVALLLGACGDRELMTPEERALEWERQLKAWEECMSEEVTHEKAEAVVKKYKDLIERQPHWYSYGAKFMWDEETERPDYDRVAIVISVIKKVDQSTLPEADRLPDCLDGVPVQFRVSSGPIFGEGE